MRRNRKSRGAARRHLARRDPIAGVGPPVAEPRRPARATARLVAHGEQDVPRRLVGVSSRPRSISGSVSSSGAPRSPAWRLRRRSRAWPRSEPRQVGRRVAEEVRRDDDAPAATRRDEVGGEAGGASTSTYSAPQRRGRSRMRRRSSSEPSKPPPSHCARQVTIDGRAAALRAPATSGRSTLSRRSSTRSASDAASRARAAPPSSVP